MHCNKWQTMVRIYIYMLWNFWLIASQLLYQCKLIQLIQIYYIFYTNTKKAIFLIRIQFIQHLNAEKLDSSDHLTLAVIQTSSQEVSIINYRAFLKKQASCCSDFKLPIIVQTSTNTVSACLKLMLLNIFHSFTRFSIFFNGRYTPKI